MQPRNTLTARRRCQKKNATAVNTTFGGLPLAERRHELKCGLWVLDARNGQTLEYLKFDKGVEEIFDVQILPDVRIPAIIGFDRETIQNTFIVPPRAFGSQSHR
jgi:hypothetical protein